MGMSVTISAASAQDAEQILKLQYLCYQNEAELYGDYTIEPLTQTLDDLRAELDRGHGLVARLGDEVVASVRGSVDATGTARIAKLIVHPRLRRRRSRRTAPGRHRDALRGRAGRPALPAVHRPSRRGQSAALPQPGLRARRDPGGRAESAARHPGKAVAPGRTWPAPDVRAESPAVREGRGRGFRRSSHPDHHPDDLDHPDHHPDDLDHHPGPRTCRALTAASRARAATGCR